jgi:hypothetical protein
MAPQRLVPELTDDEWQSWFDAPDSSLACPVEGCGRTSAAYWDGVNETLTVTGCGHTVFFPEDPLSWPPPESHVRREQAG